ncbi:hypothetical protein [Streptomyces sp. NPDC058657]|uniref:hypothetical protein n=1 Tax=unclassified Streptomyces TaxID=2593676 RepID=UPI00366798CF
MSTSGRTGHGDPQYRKAAPGRTTGGGVHWRQVGRLAIADGNGNGNGNGKGNGNGSGSGSGAVVVDARRADRWWYAVNTAGAPARWSTARGWSAWTTAGPPHGRHGPARSASARSTAGCTAWNCAADPPRVRRTHS